MGHKKLVPTGGTTRLSTIAGCLGGDDGDEGTTPATESREEPTPGPREDSEAGERTFSVEPSRQASEGSRRVNVGINRRDFIKATSVGIFTAGAIGQVTAAESTAGGDLIWTFETDAVDGVSSSPTIVDGTVFIGSSDNNVYALDAQTGEEHWSFETDRWVSSSPTVVGGTVFVGSLDSNVYALNAETGEKRWAYERGEGSESSPTVANGSVFVGGGADNHVYALDAQTGEERWTFETDSWVSSSPTVVDGIVYIGSWDHNVYALDAASGEEVWSYKTGMEVRSSPTVVDGIVYIGSDDHNVYGLNAATGEVVGAFEAASWVRATPTLNDGIGYVTSADKLYAVDMASGEEIWLFEQDQGFDLRGSPTVADGTVFVGSVDDEVFALDAASGDNVWTATISNVFSSSPTVVDGIIYFGSADGTIYALDAGVDGSSTGSRVNLGTLGHHHEWAEIASIASSPDTTEASTDTAEDSTDTTEASTDTTEASTDTAEETPGFGIGAAVSGLGGAAYLLKRRLVDDSEEA